MSTDTTARPAAPARSRPRLPTARAVLGWAGRVLCWVVVLGLAGVLLLAVLVPRAAGATPYAVLSGSMEPALPVGSMIVVRPTDPDRVRLGDVITYQLRSGEPTVVTHRVVASRTQRGERVFLTQGDVNDEPDAEPVRAVQVRGSLWYSLPHLGRLTTALEGETRSVLSRTGALALVGYAVVMLVGGVRERRGRPT